MSPRRLLVLLASLCALVLALPAAAAGAEVMRIDDPITDNYKASYNADPSRAELRAWLAMQAVRAAGTSWKPVAGSSIAVLYGGSVDVRAADGRSGRLTARVTSGPAGSPAMRVDPVHVESRGRWGMLITLTDRRTHQSTPVRIALTLTSGSATLATGAVEYRHDPKLAAVASTHLEYNGPYGRWYVGGVATRNEWQPTPATAPSLLAGQAAARPIARRPLLRRLVLPRRTRSRVVAMRVYGRAQGARITHIRVSVGRGYGRWVRTSARYRLVLPKGRATRRVTVQLRDARGRISRPGSRLVTCLC